MLNKLNDHKEFRKLVITKALTETIDVFSFNDRDLIKNEVEEEHDTH
jgi:hypothetical protein